MSESAYQWTEFGLNLASTVCTILGGALNKKLSQRGTPNSGADHGDVGIDSGEYQEFDSYKDYQKSFGKASDSQVRYGTPSQSGKYEWHHIVEQCQIDKSGFSPTQIYNTDNTISLGYKTHRKISGIYSSRIDRLTEKGINGLVELFNGVDQSLTVRTYMQRLNYAEQMTMGKEILKLLGVII